SAPSDRDSRSASAEPVPTETRPLVSPRATLPLKPTHPRLTSVSKGRGTPCHARGSKVADMAASSEIRAQLGHPVIDADGHVLEYLPAVEPHLREALGPRAFERYRAQS